MRHGTVVALETEERDAGKGRDKGKGTDMRRVARCPSCRGAFVEYEDLIALETAARSAGKQGINDTSRFLASNTRRGMDLATPPIACPSCNSETTRREWSIGTMVFVDVCIECRGVWLDGGELETLT